MGKKTAATQAFTDLVCTNRALRRASRRLGQLYDEALAPMNLKATQVALLVEIDQFAAQDEGQGPTLQFLAGRLAILISALTHALRPLVRDAIVEVRPDAYDKRTKHAILTLLGRERLREALVFWAAANRQVEVVLGPGAVATLHRLADEIASDEFLAAYHDGQRLPGHS
ncbi:MAG: Transcriptional regulator, MarR family [Akkermansiaceae bacterium]|nr:Transcriptional regulator, MarR family [Akkermansiaceae bacterium]